MIIASIDSLVLSRQWIGKFKPTIQIALSLYEALSPAHYTDALGPITYIIGTVPSPILQKGTKYIMNEVSQMFSNVWQQIELEALALHFLNCFPSWLE